MLFNSKALLISLLALSHRLAKAQNFDDDDVSAIPSRIRLRAGVLHSPPFAVVNQVNATDSEFLFQGYQPDLLQRLQQFAKEDGVSLDFDLSPSPPQYGAALDLVANDCRSVAGNATDCDKFDIIVGDYYVNAERSMRIDFTPAFLKTTISTIKKKRQEETTYVDEDTIIVQDYTTLSEASRAGAKVCVLEGAYMQQVIRQRFPGAQYVECPDQDTCLEYLKRDDCVLYADDELMLRYRQTLDPALEVTREQFNSQFVAWVMRDTLPPMVSKLLKKWMYAAVANATTDELYFKYFQTQLCPVGTAGENCEKPCDANHGIANEQGVCVCTSIRFTGEDCSIVLQEDTNAIPTELKAVAFAMLAINVLVIVVCGAWLWLYRNSAPVRVSQPFFLVLVLLGCLISSSTIIALTQEDEDGGDVPACMAIPWLYSIGFCVTFGTLFAKILRIYKVFTQMALPYLTSSNTSTAITDGSSGESRRTVIHRGSATFRETLQVIGAVLAIDICILTAWTVLDPLKYQRDVIQADHFGAPLESQGYCYSDHWQIFGSLIAAFHLCLLGVASYLCFKARKIPSKYSESKHVSFALVSNLQIFVIGVPILVIVSNDPGPSFFVRSAIIWMNDLAVVAILFSNLMWSVHVVSKRDTADIDRLKMKRAVSHYSASGNNSGAMSHSGRSHCSYSNSSPLSPECPFVADEVPEPDDSRGTTKPRQGRRSLVSSLSSMSAGGPSQTGDTSLSTPATPNKPREKTVSWGLATYSEVEGKSSISISLGSPPSALLS